jgi:hypothetical protein
MTETKGWSKVTMPFTAYDFFGYLVPGGSVLLCVYLFEHTLISAPYTGARVPVLHVLEMITEWLSPGMTFGKSLLAFTCLLIMAYVVGHVVALLSALFVDRVFVTRTYGYPYERLFSKADFAKGWTLRPEKRWLGVKKQEWYAALFLFVVLSVGMQQFLRPWKWWMTLLAVASPVIIGVVVIPLRRWMQSTFSGSTVFNTEFADDFGKRFDHVMKVRYDLDEPSTNIYWLAACYVLNGLERFASMLNNWLHLYSFLRNAGMAFYLAHLYMVVSIVLQPSVSEAVMSSSTSTLLLLLIGYLVLAILMAFRYYYVYFLYYSKFLFRAFVYLTRGYVEHEPYYSKDVSSSM